MGELYGGRQGRSSYVTADVNFLIKDFPVKNLEMTLKLRNITDKRYYTRGLFGKVRGQGSSMYFTIGYKF